MKHRTTAMTVVLAAAFLSAAAICYAIVWGEPDGNRHPNVGALFLRFDPEVFDLGIPGVPPGVLPVCSGCIIAKDDDRALFLTAGHCAQVLLARVAALAPLNPQVVVSFSSNLHQDLGVLIPVDMEAMYWQLGPFPPSFPDGGVLHDALDIAMLVLQAEDADDLPEPVRLAPAGLLDSLGPAGLTRSQFRVVGYGDDILEPTPIGRALVYGTREVASPRAVNMTENWLVAQQHGPAGSSGVYFGDSGGPVFWVNPITGQETQVAIIAAALGPADVATLAQHFRIDTSTAIEFINDVATAEGFLP